jgi:hypothetical protein
MSLDLELLALMTQTITIAPYTGQNAYAAPQFDTPVSYSCRVSAMNEYVRSHDGREVVAKGKVYVAMTTIPSVQDRVVLPVAYLDEFPPILNVLPEIDDAGDVNHVVLILG